MNNYYLILAAAACGSAYVLWLGYTLWARKFDTGLLLAVGLFFDLFIYFLNLFGSPIPPTILLALLIIMMAVPFVLTGLSVIRSLLDPGILIWITFLVYCGISLSWSSNPDYGAHKIAVMVLRGFIPGLVAYVTYKAHGRLQWTPALVLGTAYSLIVLVFGTITEEYPGRVTLPGFNPIMVARTGFLLSTVALWVPRLNIVIRWTLLGLGILTGLVTQSRGPLVAFLGSIIISMFSARSRTSLSKAVPMVVLCLFAAGWLIELIPYAIGDRISVLGSRSLLIEDANFQSRLWLAHSIGSLFLDSPFMGVGLGGIAPSGTRLYPHNIFIETGVELGLAGLILLLLGLTFSLRRAQKDRLLTSMLVQALLNSLVSGDLGTNYGLFMVGLFALTRSGGTRDCAPRAHVLSATVLEFPITAGANFPKTAEQNSPPGHQGTEDLAQGRNCHVGPR